MTEATTKELLLEVDDLHVSFPTKRGEVQAVRGVSFSLYKGETLAIVGESGCGKSVTAQSLMRLVSTPPKSGSIRYKGEELTTKTEKQMQKLRGLEMGMIFQDPMTSLNPVITVGEQIREGLLRHQKMSKDEATKEAIEMLRLVGIADPDKRMKQYPHQFSGGMRQRLMIAMALVCKPDILIADEPTTALDVTIQAQIIELFQEIQRKTGVAIIIITHDLGVVAQIADRICVMYAGKIAETGTSYEVFKEHRHPYTEGILKSVPRMDGNRDVPLIPVPGTPPNLMNPPVGCPFYMRCDYAMKVCKEVAPPRTDCNESHYVHCWLQDERAPSIKQLHS
ncbi:MULTISPECIES: ABC transporter ATP-binding protein [Geomicrobium]|uniref:Oligopeptide/dipeptide ABC transporter ATP-binding protein n=1 Tax=Geomicrobium sediminis TaxID=1347788 RepID=A0ABS2PE88_9BACL|nr:MULTISPECIES: ABC transporter ATP-binding protein [Geomicrobium]MBM7633291.1 oligopeptide/dipeptide ABC transporter ATP-binding protein [Geomicrobium sediminis]GAK00849.1 oligopeptide transport ATP-binding protein OppD [Geomicrobium sp. JCM 19055]